MLKPKKGPGRLPLKPKKARFHSVVQYHLRKKPCMICGTKIFGEIILVPLYSSSERNVCEAQPFHAKCVITELSKIIAARGENAATNNPNENRKPKCIYPMALVKTPKSPVKLEFRGLGKGFRTEDKKSV